MTEDEIMEIESVANTLRGASMDPRIPALVRDVLRRQAERLDVIAEAHMDE